MICSTMTIYFTAIASVHGVIFSENQFCSDFLYGPWDYYYIWNNTIDYNEYYVFNNYGINILWIMVVCIIGWVS